MTAESGDETELQDITGPTTAPSNVPDPLTKKAINWAKTDATRPTQSQRLDAAVERHIAHVCGERDTITQENGRLHGELDRLRNELSPLRVDHQNLKVTLRFSLVWNAVSTVLLTVG